MKFAVISAGEGSRLSQEGCLQPKPLVNIGGRPMIGRLLGIMRDCGAERIAVIVNPANAATLEYLRSVQNEFALDIVVQATPSPMHSLMALAPYLRGGRFCATTVDTVFREDEFRSYIRAFNEHEGDGLMGVTRFADDEKPLFVSADSSMKITGFHDSADEIGDDDVYVSAGIYGLKESAWKVLEKCLESGKLRMRVFQRQLVADGLDLRAYCFGKVVDVDHVKDIPKACEID